jgi:hypothetical protein
MDFVLVEEIEEQPFRYVIEKNLGGTVGDVTYEQATEILESLVWRLQYMGLWKGDITTMWSSWVPNF